MRMHLTIKRYLVTILKMSKVMQFHKNRVNKKRKTKSVNRRKYRLNCQLMN